MKVIRKTIFPERSPSERGFSLRGAEIQRIETFSDAVFAFAVTLLIVSLEVPRTFEELLISIRGFMAFAICFTFLLLVWYEQHMFFRRYGLDDRTTVFLNAALLFIVLFYVYPLKFLFSLIFSDEIYGAGKTPFAIKEHQVPQLMVIYGVGYVVIYLVFLLLHLHARRKRLVLDLSRHEIFDTNTKIYGAMIMIGLGLISIVMALFLHGGRAGFAGMVYVGIGPVYWVLYGRRGVLRRRMG